MRHMITLAVASAALAIATPAIAQEAEDAAIIELRGHGEVTATPDIAYISSGVTTQAETARDALTANTDAMNQLIKVLKSAGVEEKDIQTSNFSVQPQYVYSEKRDENGYSQPPKINGYQVSNSVNVRVREIDSLGTVLDQAVTVGANTIDNISFGVADPSALLNEARKEAVKDAIAKADLYAEAAEFELGRIVSISEGGYMPLPKRGNMRTMDMMAEAAAPVPVQSGELSYSIDVAVRWELQD